MFWISSLEIKLKTQNINKIWLPLPWGAAANYTSKHNQELFEKFYADYDVFVEKIGRIKQELVSLIASKEELLKRQAELKVIRQGMVEEFAEIERKLAEELKSGGTQNIISDEFLSLKNS